VLTIIVFIVILGLLIFVHELGHFWVAKRNGVKVEEFGFGFPPRIFGIKRGETTYSLNLIPLGGFVKILGEGGQEKQNPRSFAAKKIWRRAAILASGVTMNILLAVVLLSIGFMIGLPSAVDDDREVVGAKVKITQVEPGSPAERAGLKTGDAILAVSNPVQQIEIQKVAQVQEFSDQNRGQEISLAVEREKQLTELKIIPAQEGLPLGVGLTRVADISYPWYRAIYEGLLGTIALVWLIISYLGVLLWQLIVGGQMVGEIAGPVGIFNLTGQAARMGFIYILQLTVLLTVNLAIINALPFPALDGGRLLFLLVEKIKGSPVSQRIEQAVHAAGFIFLILLMVLITVRDVIKLF